MHRIYLIFLVAALCGACSGHKSTSTSAVPVQQTTPIAPANPNPDSGVPREEITAGAGSTLLAIPNQLRAEVLEERIVYRWAPVPDAAAYAVYYATKPGVFPGDAAAKRVDVSANEFSLQDPEVDTRYYAVVVAVDRTGREGAASNQVVAELLPTRVFQLGFDSAPISSGYAMEYHNDNSSLSVQEQEPDRTHYLRATYIPNEIGSPRLTFMRDFKRGRSYTLSYKVFFEDEFDFGKGGKLPGLGPRQPVTGCGENLLSGWSVRLMWLTRGRVGLYYYDQERNTVCGNTEVASGFQFETGRWYDISLFVKLNSNNERNGEIALFIDGTLAVNRLGVRLRAMDEPDSEIQRFLFATFFGGSSPEWAPHSVVHARFDKFEVHRGFHIRALGRGH